MHAPYQADSLCHCLSNTDFVLLLLPLQMCANCSIRQTTAWRRDTATGLYLCNACGMFMKNKGRHRTQELIDSEAQRVRHQHTHCQNPNPEPSAGAAGPSCSQPASPLAMGPAGLELCAAHGTLGALNRVAESAAPGTSSACSGPQRRTERQRQVGVLVISCWYVDPSGYRLLTSHRTPLQP